MNRLTTQQLTDIRERADKATEGEWSVGGMDDQIDAEGATLSVAYDVMDVNDADFIANSRQDIPALLTEVETLIAEKAEAKRKVDCTSAILLEMYRQGTSTISIEMVEELLDVIRKALTDDGA